MNSYFDQSYGNLNDDFEESYNQKYCSDDFYKKNEEVEYFGIQFNDENVENKSTNETNEKLFNQKKFEEEKDDNASSNVENNNETNKDNLTQEEKTLYFIKRPEDKPNMVITEETKTEKQIVKQDQDNYTDNKSNKEFIGKKRQDKKENLSNDKIFKQVRIMILRAIRDFVNQKIKYYIKNIGKGLLEKQFKEIDKKNLSHSRVDFDKDFLGLKLKEIFSWDITRKMTNFLPNHNRKLLDELLNSDIGNEFFPEFFELTFRQCFEHIQPENPKYAILDGFYDHRQIIENFCDEKKSDNGEIYKHYEHVVLHYQEYVEKKVARKPRKKNNEKTVDMEIDSVNK